MTSEGEQDRAPGTNPIRDWALHILCVLALMWTPLANGFAFFFDDTTNYIRAADMAAHMASGKTFTTAWSDRYTEKLPAGSGDAQPEAEKPAEDPAFRTHNDISSGLVMTGRSPYMGALMWVGYVTSNFWLFILFQAWLAYFLIRLALRRFGIIDPVATTGIVLLLAALTTLPFYNGMLLADAFGAFGIVALLLLATPGKLTKFEVFVLFMTIVTAVVSHMTHIVMIAGMLAALLGLRLVNWAPDVPRRGWIAGIAGLAIGFVSLQVTAFATEAAIGQKPQMLPLMTARFIADGPGKSFIDSGCDGNRFQICRVELNDTSHASAILSNPTPGIGTYLLATPEERRTMGEEDTAFAIAVMLHDPIGQGAAIARNTFRQLTWVQYTGLNRACSARAYCWDAIPQSVGEDMKRTLADKEAWPEGLMDAVLKLTVAASLIVLVICLFLGRSDQDGRWRTLRNWALLTLSAMIMISGFGGAVVEPQWRYISRLIWLVPLFAMIAMVIRWRPALARPTHQHAA